MDGNNLSFKIYHMLHVYKYFTMKHFEDGFHKKIILFFMTQLIRIQVMQCNSRFDYYKQYSNYKTLLYIDGQFDKKSYLMLSVWKITLIWSGELYFIILQTLF
jgi:hypothetical protein